MRRRAWGALGVLLLAIAACQAPADAIPRCRGSFVGVWTPHPRYGWWSPGIEIRWMPGRCPRTFTRPPSITLPVPTIPQEQP